MRSRLIVALVVAVSVLFPKAAWALCQLQPFDRVVRSSDAVLVATVVGGASRGPHRSGFIVRLDVEQVLKGSAVDGQRVLISPCGPIIAGSTAELVARRMIGTRELFLLSRSGEETFSQYSQITTPQDMTLEQRIERARDVLGVTPAPPRAPLQHDGGIPLGVWAIGLGALVVALVFVVRRSRRV
jgi:hypothetical protein